MSKIVSSKEKRRVWYASRFTSAGKTDRRVVVEPIIEAPVVIAPVRAAPVMMAAAVMTAEAEVQTGRVYTCDTCVHCAVCRTKRQLSRNATPDERRIHEDAAYHALEFEYRRQTQERERVVAEARRRFEADMRKRHEDDERRRRCEDERIQKAVQERREYFAQQRRSKEEKREKERKEIEVRRQEEARRREIEKKRHSVQAPIIKKVLAKATEQQRNRVLNNGKKIPSSSSLNNTQTRVEPNLSESEDEFGVDESRMCQVGEVGNGVDDDDGGNTGELEETMKRVSIKP